MDRHLTEDELVLHYYGEMSDAAEGRACAHMDACAECRTQLSRLQRVLALVDAGATPEPAATFEARTWQQVEPVLRRELPRRRAYLPLPLLRPVIAKIAWGAAAAVLVLAAFVAGRVWPDPPAASVVTTAPAAAVDRVLLVDLGDHLDRAELTLVEFIARNPAEVAARQARAEDLIAANRLYRGTAIAIGDQGVVDVLDELERALIEIAATPVDADESDLDAVRQWIESRDLLFKLRVMREMLQERAPAATLNQRQDSSL